jgi:hypothetical protein
MAAKVSDRLISKENSSTEVSHENIQSQEAKVGESYGTVSA